MMLFPRSHISQNRLTAFVDERLPAGARDRVAQHLDACEACRSAERDMRALRSALRSLPQVRAPRPFALREADVRAAPAPRPLLVQVVPLLSGVTALALFAFMALLSIDVFVGSSGGGAKSATRFALPAGVTSGTAAQASAGAQPATVAADTYTEQSRETAVFETSPPATTALGAIERLTSTVSAEATPPAGPETPPAPSEAPPVSGLNSPTALDQTGAVSPGVLTLTPTSQLTQPPAPTISAPAPKEATATASSPAVPGLGRTDGSAPAGTIQPTRTPLPTLGLRRAPEAASGGSGGDGAIHAAEAALAAVAVVSGGGLFVAWRRRGP